MKAAFVFSFFFWLLGVNNAFAQVWKVVIPDASGISQGHLKYPSVVSGHTHFGADIYVGNNACGSPIYPLASGSVMRVTSGYSGGLGNAIMIKHPKIGANGGDLYTIYLHMESAPNIMGKALVEGDLVYSGISIGKVGATGFANGECHMHFEIRNFYFSSAPGNGWYHTSSTRCSDGALNIYGCGDLRNALWAMSAWENPATYPPPPCNPSKERCTMRTSGSIGWYPPVSSCQEATQWFKLIRDTTNQVSRIEPATKNECPLACFKTN